eukprot:4552128-Alexandrium_andersonii.AAC.1
MDGNGGALGVAEASLDTLADEGLPSPAATSSLHPAAGSPLASDPGQHRALDAQIKAFQGSAAWARR